LELLEKKPGGLVNAKVVRHMPLLWKDLLAKMKQKLHRGDKEFIKTLLLLRSYSEEVKDQTVIAALKQSLFIAEEIHDLARKAENHIRGALPSPFLPTNVGHCVVLAPDMAVYDQLIHGMVHLDG